MGSIFNPMNWDFNPTSYYILLNQMFWYYGGFNWYSLWESGNKSGIKWTKESNILKKNELEGRQDIDSFGGSLLLLLLLFLGAKEIKAHKSTKKHGQSWVDYREGQCHYIFI